MYVDKEMFNADFLDPRLHVYVKLKIVNDSQLERHSDTKYAIGGADNYIRYY